MSYCRRWHCRENSLPPALLGEMSLLMPVAAKMHGKSEHAMHEDRVVTHAGPIQSLGVDIMRVGTHYDVREHPVHCQHHVRMLIEGVQVVLVVVHGPVQLGQAAELHLDDGVEAAE